MTRLTMMAGAFCVALLTSPGAFAQVPPAEPGNPNEVVPEAMNPPAYGEPINLATAKKVATAAAAEVAKRNWHGMCIAVVDPHGELVYFERDDNCQFASVSISVHKARAAARYRRPTLLNEDAVFEGWVTEVTERRIFSRGRIVQGGVVTVEAEGEFAILNHEGVDRMASGRRQAFDGTAPDVEG